MAEKLFLVHGETKRRFEIIEVNREAGTIKLKGEFSTFDEAYNPASFKAKGYHLEKVQVDE